MLSADYFIEEIDTATRFNSKAKQVCNDALSKARGKIQKLQTDIEAKDARIKDLEEQVQALMSYAGDLYSKSGSAEELSGQDTEGCEDRWITCSERMPEVSEDVLIKIRLIFSGINYSPRTGFWDGKRWQIFGNPGHICSLPEGFNVIAWRSGPEDYIEPEVKPEPVEVVKFEVGDFVLCVSRAGVKINAVYLREDEEHYWILDKQCLTQQPLDKNHWKLTKYPGHMSVVEWLCSL
jgi:hypothetical protein